ncbi:MAG: hypothetical protein OXQ29_15840 [Rhodospirillaceae bacterium]|nr:hypothetical protein [Rhodospirillaceae bacterium]
MSGLFVWRAKRVVKQVISVGAMLSAYATIGLLAANLPGESTTAAPPGSPAIMPTYDAVGDTPDTAFERIQDTLQPSATADGNPPLTLIPTLTPDASAQQTSREAFCAQNPIHPDCIQPAETPRPPIAVATPRPAESESSMGVLSLCFDASGAPSSMQQASDMDRNSVIKLSCPNGTNDTILIIARGGNRITIDGAKIEP